MRKEKREMRRESVQQRRKKKIYGEKERKEIYGQRYGQK